MPCIGWKSSNIVLHSVATFTINFPECQRWGGTKKYRSSGSNAMKILHYYSTKFHGYTMASRNMYACVSLLTLKYGLRSSSKREHARTSWKIKLIFHLKQHAMRLFRCPIYMLFKMYNEWPVAPRVQVHDPINRLMQWPSWI